MITLSLPWPPPALSPNARGSWRKKHGPGKKQKADACFLAASYKRKLDGADTVSVAMTFCPPDARHYDADNLVGRMKWALDGIAAGIGIDDSNFRLEAPVIARPERPNGWVIVTLSPLASQEAA